MEKFSAKNWSVPFARKSRVVYITFDTLTVFRSEGERVGNIIIQKAMIESAITHSIKEMGDDPKRSVRRLADLGKQFSKNRFQDQIFTVIQELLQNDDSAYYDMINNLLKNADHDAIRQFGMNFGYMGWCYGAANIREEQKKEHRAIPWCVMLRIDECEEDPIRTSELQNMVDTGQQLGIYVYFIRQKNISRTPSEMLNFFMANPNCAFVWLRESGQMSAAEIQMLRNCRNVLPALPVADDESLLTVTLLRDCRVLYSLYMEYDDSITQMDQQDIGDSLQHTINKVLTTESCMFFLVRKDGTLFSSAQYCYHSRLRQEYPCLIMDYYGDADSLSNVTVDHRNLLEIGSDRKIILPEAHAGETFDFSRPLRDCLCEIMPEI